MNNLFKLASQCLHQDSVHEKLRVTHKAWALYQAGELEYQMDYPITPISQTQFPQRPQLKSHRDMPRRKFNTEQGVTALLHALAHIEFMAINLAWDILYRFRNLPEQFYQDWLKVAEEEAQHFTLLKNHLLQRGVDYGDLPAHDGLWVRAEQTADDLLGRLALVPRCMEARGLDVTPAMIKNFKKINDFKSAEILTTILNDEVGHVKIGTDWFNFVCGERQLDPESSYQQLILQYLKEKPKGPFNKEMRIIAGFTQAELDWLENDE
jgi:uncharacterized ferritin-like protein (DUF455 family)